MDLRMKTLAFSPMIMLAALLAAGCASTDPTRVEEDFGKSVRHMVKAQTLNPQAAENPATDLPSGIDGQKGDAILEAFRADVAKPGEVAKPIKVNAGN